MIFKLIKKLIILSLLIGVALAIDMYSFLSSPMNLVETTYYEFESGSSASSLVRDLKKQNILSRPFYLSVWTRISGQAKKLKVGEYKLTPGMTPFDLLSDMENAKVKQYSITLVEGRTFWQMMNQINESAYLKHYLKGLTDAEIMQRIGHGGEHPEGRFYPDTYHFPKGMTDIQFLKRAYDEMDRRLNQAWAKRDIGLPFDTPYEALTLASIVEKESALAEERTQIAGVFINRLRKKMRLQTDPTVIYGLGPSFDGDIRFRDLKRDTPYNTYTRKGLPPTPIAMPGQGAIDAVMHPDTTPYIYFVARGDKTGSHVFSETLTEHEKAVDKYQRKRNKK
ncbi:MAG: endolytic transglycosylase MltG [Gammaproteobacteria bacterium]|nr:endolytic transglycosylase MltG [Gammaproteobacteria bacterium]